MTDNEITHKTDGSGQLAPGNRWAYKKGQSGHPAKYNYKGIVKKIQSYLDEHSTEDARPISWSGLSRHLGLTMSGFQVYRDGRMQKDGSAIKDALDYFAVILESDREERLTMQGQPTAGLMFALKNHHGWRDEKHLNVTEKKAQPVAFVLDPSSQLAKQLHDAGSVIIEQDDDNQ